MQLVDAHGKALLICASGEIHAPASLFLNSNYDNPHSRGTVALGIRLLHLFTQAAGISLPARALQGQCLHPKELDWLSNLAYRPIEELESMNDRMLMRLAKTEDVAHRDRSGAVAATTASQRLGHIADFLRWYLKNILDPRIRSTQLRAELQDRYESSALYLKGKIRGGNAKHPTQIRSLPTDVFKRIIREIYVHPEQIFCTASGEPCSTPKRDRAIFLLACEGMRPGAIGNLRLEDFESGQIRIHDNAGRRGTRITEGTPVQKGARSNKQDYNSELSMTLWPWTIDSIHDYINTERDALLGIRLHNASKGFLFLESNNAGPIKNRKTISNVFKRARASLHRQGLLARSSADRYVKAKKYNLTGYTLRHSSATLYLAEKGNSDQTRSEMKERYGWTPNSHMPDRYGRRANMDAASVDLGEFWDSIQAERTTLRGR